MKTRVLELNSSDERGINVIREKVKTFSQFTPSGHRQEYISIFCFLMIIQIKSFGPKINIHARISFAVANRVRRSSWLS